MHRRYSGDGYSYDRTTITAGRSSSIGYLGGNNDKELSGADRGRRISVAARIAAAAAAQHPTAVGRSRPLPAAAAQHPPAVGRSLPLPATAAQHPPAV
jgi:hypothetical protein